MPKYRVTVSFTQKKELTVYASDPETAMEKAEDIILKWDRVTDCEALDAEEEE